MKYICDAIQVSQTLTHLYIYFVDKNIDSIKYLNEAIRYSKTLTHLYTFYDINIESMKYLSG